MIHLHIYTDGSHIKGTPSKGFGAWCRYDGQEYWLSGRVTTQWLRETYGIMSSRVSNPTMELIACCQILELFRGRKTNILIYVDYEGVSKWINGQWRAKRTYIRILVDLCKQYIEEIEGLVSFIDVPAHTGIEGNEKADRAAKDPREYNTFPELLAKIPQTKQNLERTKK